MKTFMGIRRMYYNIFQYNKLMKNYKFYALAWTLEYISMRVAQDEYETE